MCNYTVDDIPWGTLLNAHGTSEHLPNALLALCSEDERTREEAYWRLDNYAVLQGDIYEVAPYVVHIVVSFLQRGNDFPGRKRVYDLLLEIAYGEPASDIQSDYCGQSTPLKEACDKAIDRGLDIYLGDLSNESPNVRRRAAELLLKLSERVSIRSSQLGNAMRRETDTAIRKLLGELVEASQVP